MSEIPLGTQTPTVLRMLDAMPPRTLRALLSPRARRRHVVRTPMTPPESQSQTGTRSTQFLSEIRGVTWLTEGLWVCRCFDPTHIDDQPSSPGGTHEDRVPNNQPLVLREYEERILTVRHVPNAVGTGFRHGSRSRSISQRLLKHRLG